LGLTAKRSPATKRRGEKRRGEGKRKRERGDGSDVQGTERKENLERREKRGCGMGSAGWLGFPW
jgi:hypothetical protein